jgi:hypothetical protein
MSEMTSDVHDMGRLCIWTVHTRLLAVSCACCPPYPPPLLRMARPTPCAPCATTIHPLRESARWVSTVGHAHLGRSVHVHASTSGQPWSSPGFVKPGWVLDRPWSSPKSLSPGWVLELPSCLGVYARMCECRIHTVLSGYPCSGAAAHACAWYDVAACTAALYCCLCVLPAAGEWWWVEHQAGHAVHHLPAPHLQALTCTAGGSGLPRVQVITREGAVLGVGVGAGGV